jgi:broad specificity phosphatase PhoE
MATTVYLTRHGQTEWNSIGRMMGWTDEDMNETGLAQAGRLATRMAKMRLDAVYTSPLKRTISTGIIVGKSHGIIPKTAQGLIEINYGIWEGLARIEVKKKWPELQQQLHDDPSELAIPGGETFKQLAVRVVAAFNEIVKAEEGKHILMVSHQGILKVLVAELMGISYRDWGKFEIRNASLTTMTVNNGHIHVITLNDISHLEGVSPE